MQALTQAMKPYAQLHDCKYRNKVYATLLYRVVGASPVPARALCTHFTRNAHKLRKKKMTHVVKPAFVYHKQQSNQNLQLVRGKTLIPLDYW